MIRLAAVVLCLLLAPATAEPLPAATPEAHGTDSGKLAEALLKLDASGKPIHSLLLARDGEVILNAVFYPYDGSTLHEVASVTKSVTTSLVAIAAAEGKLALDAPLLSFFPERTIANRDARKERITLRDLMRMASGLDCVAEPREPTLGEMEHAPDWVQFTLDLKMVAEPGTTFSYCSPGMHLLSAVLTKATGMPAFDYARQKLFAPLGIVDAFWPADAAGNSHGWGDLYLFPADMAKLGVLWLNGGVWQGRQIIQADWMAAASSVQMAIGGGVNYGYGFWIGKDRNAPVFFANGRGGQRIVMLPERHAVEVITAGGMDPAAALDLLAGAQTNPNAPLPPNAKGEAELKDALATVSAEPLPQAVAPPPDIAARVSGLIYRLEPNPLDIASVRLDFPGGAEATLTLGSGQGPTRAGPVGLDGRFRWSPGENGIPLGIRGAWTDARTFVVDYDTVGCIDGFTVTSQFADNAIAMSFADRDSGYVLQVSGTIESGN